jgi:hypothetical protein
MMWKQVVMAYFFGILLVFAWKKNLLYLSRDLNPDSHEHETGELPTWPEFWSQTCLIIVILKIMGFTIYGNLLKLEEYKYSDYGSTLCDDHM